MAIVNEELPALPHWKRNTKKQENKKKSKEIVATASAISHGNSMLNNELNVKIDFNAITNELKG